MKTVTLDQIPRTPVAMDGAHRAHKQLVLGSQDGAPTFSFRVFTLDPGGHTPFHQHESEHLNYVISGRGALVDPDGKQTPLQQGDFALVLPNEKHQYLNTSGTEPLLLLCAVPAIFE